MTDYIITQAGHATAERVVSRITEHLEGLCIFPHRGTALRRGLRRIGDRRFLTIVFRVTGDEMRILRITYRGRDLAKEFS